jgi:hypothetical protein
MQFRIKHLLMATLAVALLATSMGHPSQLTENLVRLAVWAAAAILATRAIARPGRERAVIAAGLLVGASFLWFDSGPSYGEAFPISTFLEWVAPSHDLNRDDNGLLTGGFNSFPNARHLREIGRLAFALLFAVIAACLAAVWTQRDDDRFKQATP